MPEPTKPVATAQPASQPSATEPPVQQPVEQKPEEQVAEVSDRTKEQFDKLLENNQRLFEANELLQQELVKRQQAAQTFQPIQQPPTQQTPQQVNPNDFVEVDEYGNKFVNEVKLQTAINTLNDKATRAEQVVQNYIQNAEQREIDRQNKEAYASYPELDPTDKDFNPEFSDFTRAVIYDSLINSHRYDGRGLSFKEAADLVKSRTGGNQKVEEKIEEKEETSKADEAQEAKEQGSLEPVTQPQGQTAGPDEDLEQLRQITRLGGTNSDRAIAQRLTRIPHVRKASEEEA